MKKRIASMALACTMLTTMAAGTVPAQGKAEAASWSEQVTKDGWVYVINENGKDLGYSPDSGMSLLTVDGLAFKDASGDGVLYPYMDWRLDADTRAADLASRLSIEQLADLMISYQTAPAGLTAEEQIVWANDLQAQAEKNNSFGIPVNVYATEDQVSGGVSSLAKAATFDVQQEATYAASLSKELRALGIQTYVGPSANLATEPRWDEVVNTFGEDPALSRDMNKAIVDALQSTKDENENDLGWGSESVAAIITNWPGDGSSESGRSNSRWWGSYNVYPGDQKDVHLIPFVDGGFALEGQTGMASGVLASYANQWDENGENLAGAFSYAQNQLLRSYGFDGIIYADWAVNGDMGYGSDVQYFEPYEKVLLSIFAGTDAFLPLNSEVDAAVMESAVQLGIDLLNGNYEEPSEGMEISGVTTRVEYANENASSETKVADSEVRVIINPLKTILPVMQEAFAETMGTDGEAQMRQRLEQSAVRILRSRFQLGLFENPYVSSEQAIEALAASDLDALSAQIQQQSIVMLKNDQVISENWAGEKPTVYVPLTLSLSQQLPNHTEGEAHWVIGTQVPMETLENYFNVITDTVTEELTGTVAEDGTVYASIDDIIRADAETVAQADFVLVFMNGPMNAIDSSNNGVSQEAWYPETAPWDYHFIHTNHIQYKPIALQYRSYRATNDYVRQPSLAGRSIWWYLAGVYGDSASHEDESRAYFGQRSASINKHELTMLDDVTALVPENIPVIVAMNTTQAYVFDEIEEDVDVILLGFDIDNASFLPIVMGMVEPQGLLPIQMPEDMVAVEANNEDVPRDMTCFEDSLGNTYDFTYGLNWSGIIQDARTKTYSVDVLTAPEAVPVN